MKTCTVCKEEKDESCFSLRKSGKRIGTPLAHCKDCNAKKNKDYYKRLKADPDKIKAYRERDKAHKRACSEDRTKNISYRITQYKHGAKARGFLWELTNEEAALFYQVPCTYCGNTINGLGIDRIDSSIGYKLSNCVPCCTICNRMKLNYDKDMWFEHMQRILKHQGFC